MTPERARAAGREAGRNGLSDRIPYEHLEAMSDEAVFEFLEGHAEGSAVRAATPPAPEERAA